MYVYKERLLLGATFDNCIRSFESQHFVLKFTFFFSNGFNVFFDHNLHHYSNLRLQCFGKPNGHSRLSKKTRGYGNVRTPFFYKLFRAPICFYQSRFWPASFSFQKTPLMRLPILLSTHWAQFIFLQPCQWKGTMRFSNHLCTWEKWRKLSCVNLSAQYL